MRLKTTNKYVCGAAQNQHVPFHRKNSNVLRGYIIRKQTNFSETFQEIYTRVCNRLSFSDIFTSNSL